MEGFTLIDIAVRSRACRRIWRAKSGKWAYVYLEKVSPDRGEVVIDYPENNIRVTFVLGSKEWAVVKGTIEGEGRIDPDAGGKLPIDPGRNVENPSEYTFQGMAQWAREILVAPRMTRKKGGRTCDAYIGSTG